MDTTTILGFLPWCPTRYDYHTGLTKAFGLTSEEILFLHVDRYYHVLTFKVRSKQALDRVAECYYDSVFLPVLDESIMECFVCPWSPQMKVYKFVGFFNHDIVDVMSESLSKLGTVLYISLRSSTVPITYDFESDTVGAVVLLKEELMKTIKDSPALPSYTGGPGNGQDDKKPLFMYMPDGGICSGGTTYYMPPGGSTAPTPQACYGPGYLVYQGTMVQPPVYPNQYPGQQNNYLPSYGAVSNGLPSTVQQDQSDCEQPPANMWFSNTTQAPNNVDSSFKDLSLEDEGSTQDNQKPEAKYDEYQGNGSS